MDKNAYNEHMRLIMYMLNAVAEGDLVSTDKFERELEKLKEKSKEVDLEFVAQGEFCFNTSFADFGFAKPERIFIDDMSKELPIVTIKLEDGAIHQWNLRHCTRWILKDCDENGND